jgi:hypothetical protein
MKDGGFAESVDIVLLNPSENPVTLRDFTVSWVKLSAASESIVATGVPLGSELIDYFDVRIAAGLDEATGEERGSCNWTFVAKDGKGNQTELVSLDSSTSAQLLPRTRKIVLKGAEELTGQVVLKRRGKYRVTLSVVLRDTTFDHTFSHSFLINHQ